MKFKVVLIAISILFNDLADAQTNDAVVNQYYDFNEAVAYARYEDAFTLSKIVIANIGQLDPKMQTGFNNRYAKLQEEHGDKSIAIGYYQKVVNAVPKYYVAQSALGYLYLSLLNPLTAKINAASQDTNKLESYHKEYQAILSKSISHLEIAYACDPYPDLEKLLKDLYLKAGIKRNINKLNQKANGTETNCQDLLSDF